MLVAVTVSAMSHWGALTDRRVKATVHLGALIEAFARAS